MKKSNIRQFLGILTMFVGLVLACYYGFWVMFISGIVEFITAVKAPILNYSSVGISVFKIMSASTISVFIVIIFYLIGLKIQKRI